MDPECGVVSLAAGFLCLAYVFKPALANNGLFTGLVILVVYWLSTFIAFRGLNAFANVGSKGFILGTIIPSAGLIVFALIYVLSGGKSHLPPVSQASFLPVWTSLASIVLIVSNFLAYAGMEMNAVHVNDMDNPGKNFPKAIGLSTIVILFIFIVPTLAISVGLPTSGINLTQGVLQAFDVFFAKLGMPWGTTVMALLIVVGILASVVTWIPGPSRGLLMVGKEGYLPLWLQKTNKQGMQVNIMFVQGIIVTILSIFFALSPSVQSMFWIFSAMAAQLYLIMYMVMFLAAMRLRKTRPDVPRGFRSPAMSLVGWVGFLASLLAFLIGFVEPTGTKTNQVAYTLFLVIGIVLLGCGPFILYAIRKPSWKTTEPEGYVHSGESTAAVTAK
jgi:amino acid transporter